MKKTMTFHRKKIWMVFLVCALMLLGLVGRLVYLMGVRSDYYYQKAEELHERERVIKAARGQILDAKGRILADNKTVCTISVIHSQIKDPQKVIEVLSKELEIDTDTVRKKVEKISSIERIKTNVEKSVGDVIRGYELDGVKVDEDYKRYYPYGSLASKVLGFTGGDNQGIIGLEVKYEEILKGQAGRSGGMGKSENQSGCGSAAVCAAGGPESNGRKTGCACFHTSYESAERRNLCMC